MAYDPNFMNKWSQGNALGCNQTWNYTDTGTAVATIIASGFFNPVNEGNPSPLMNIGDLIWIVASDVLTGEYAVVTAISPNITVSVFNAVLGVGSVGTANLADDAVTTDKIDDDAVTTAKIADGAVTSAKLEDLLVHHARVTMTAVQWDAMYVSPFELVAAPGVAEKLIPMRVVVNIDYGGTVFANGGAIHIQYDDTTTGGGPKASGTLAAATFIGYTADTTFGFTPVDTTLVDSTTLGTSLCISNATGAFTGGTDSAFIIDVWYAIADYA